MSCNSSDAERQPTQKSELVISFTNDTTELYCQRCGVLCVLEGGRLSTQDRFIAPRTGLEHDSSTLQLICQSMLGPSDHVHLFIFNFQMCMMPLMVCMSQVTVVAPCPTGHWDLAIPNGTSMPRTVERAEGSCANIKVNQSAPTFYLFCSASSID